MILSYLAPSGEMVGGIVAVTFFLLVAGAAYVAFKALKKTVKMAIRMLIAGKRCSFAGWYLGRCATGTKRMLS
jgi:hypothetical protein